VQQQANFNHSMLQLVYGLKIINPLKAEFNPICHLLALLAAHHIFHVSGLRVKGINARLYCCRKKLLLAESNTIKN
jgi:hypothetical protein